MEEAGHYYAWSCFIHKPKKNTARSKESFPSTTAQRMNQIIRTIDGHTNQEGQLITCQRKRKKNQNQSKSKSKSKRQR